MPEAHSDMVERKKPALLIVEDDDQIRYLVGAAAERCGEFSSVQGAADGQAALDTIRRALRSDPPSAPDLVLSDLIMPRLDGLQLIRELKRDPGTSHIPVVIMTSSNRPNDREDATAAGCCAFFDKPLRFDEFVTLVCSLPALCCPPATP